MLELWCRAVLLVVFVSAGAGKLRSVKAFEDFRDSVVALARPGRWAGPLAEPIAHALAVSVVLAETAVVVLLVVPGVHPAGYALSGLLLAAFAMTIAVALRARQRIRCRCFGSGGSVLSRMHLARNGGLVAVAALGWVLPPAVGVAAPMTLVALVFGGLVGLVVTRWEDVMFVASGRVAPAATGRDR